MQNRQLPFLFGIFLLILTASQAHSVKVNNLEIEVLIDQQGNAKITENYKLSFISEFELEDFKKNATENSTSLAMWTNDYGFFYPHFGPVAGLSLSSDSKLIFDDKDWILTLEYSTDERFARLVTQEQRSDFFSIDNRRLGAFNESGTIVIPENVSIKFILPQNSQLNMQRISPTVRIYGNELVLNAIRANSVDIEYTVIKSIIPASNDIIPGVQNIYLLIAGAALLIALIYMKRDDLEGWVETVLVEHSEIKPKKNDEELDFDN